MMLRLAMGLAAVLVGTVLLRDAATDIRAPKRALWVVGCAGVIFVGVGVATLAGWLP